MSSDGGKKYVLLRGGQYGKPRTFKKRAAMGFTTAEFDLERDMHAAFCAMEDGNGEVPSRGIQAIRQHEQHPWRVIARRLREAHNAGVEKAKLYDAVHCIYQYIAGLGAERTKKQA